MRKLSKLIDIILYTIVAIVLTAAITSALWDKPMIFSSVRSNSMYPSFQRSDMILIKSISDKDTVNIGDIVVFKVEEGGLSSKGWIVHRIIEGNEEIGYITKGDANDYTDQASGGTGPIKREWIVSKVLTIGNKPLKIPLIGYLTLWMEKLQANPYTMPVIAVILAAIVGISELINGKKKRRKKKSGLDLQLVYFFGGLTISIIMGATMLATSQRLILPYEVSVSSAGVIMGSNVGIIKVGDEIEKSLSELSNKGFFPIVATVTTKDEQIDFSHSLVTLKPGNTIETTMNLKAFNPGKYESSIYVGMFYPFLPSRLIYNLSAKSYWLALVVVSLIPGFPLMLYPLIDRNMRKKTIKEIRRLTRRIGSSINIFN
ncbi:MAG: signal peptidase I [Lutispora sp.]|nr:signal peptidase I [Lutispora sp.]